MKNLKNITAFSAFFALGMAFFSRSANAYIDPSSMTYIVQLIVGIVIAGGGAFVFYFRKLKRKLSKKNEDAPVAANSAVEDEDFDDDDEFDDSDIEETN